ncbi:MAG: prepilin-type N-terminal cleavage/methylation domain-containing protein [Oceanospirillaceae bacterium]
MPHHSNHFCLNHRLGTQQGFSLVELILVIVIMAIIAVGSTQFIVNSVKGLNDVTHRDSLANNLRISMAKIENQLQSSLSNSVRISHARNTQCVEMLPIKASAFYVSGSFANDVANNRLSTIDTIALNYNALGLKVSLGTSDSSLLYSADTHSVAKQKAAKNSEFSQLSFLSSPSLNTAFLQAAQAKLVYFVDQAISYCIVAGDLYRYSDYKVSLKQPMPETLPKREPKRVLLNQGLGSPSNFSFLPDQSLFTLVLSTAKGAEQITITQPFWLSNE